MIRSLMTVFILASLASTHVFADEVENTIKEAGQAYKDNNYSLSLERLEQAMNLVKDVQAARIIEFFPKPLKGWKLANPEKGQASPIPNVQLGMFSSVIQKYKKEIQNESGDLLSDKNKTDNNSSGKANKKEPWIQFTLLQKPDGLIKMGFKSVHALRAASPESESVPVDGYSGIMHCNDKKASCEVYFDFDGQFMLMVNSEYTAKEDVKNYVKGFDVKGLLSDQ